MFRERIATHTNLGTEEPCGGSKRRRSGVRLQTPHKAACASCERAWRLYSGS